jgi:hypothetical protein
LSYMFATPGQDGGACEMKNYCDTKRRTTIVRVSVGRRVVRVERTGSSTIVVRPLTTQALEAVSSTSIST